MQQTYPLHDLRGFPCLSYFVTIASTVNVSFRLIGKREGGNLEYFHLKYQNPDSHLRLNQGTALTLFEPLELLVEYPDGIACQCQLTNDEVITKTGKKLIDCTLSMDFSDTEFSEIVFSLTAWKEMGAFDKQAGLTAGC